MEELEILQFIKPGGLPYALLVLVVTMVVAKLLHRFVVELGQRFADKRLVLNQLGSLLRFAVFTIGCFVSTVFVVDLSREVLIAIGGTVAVALGFALKDFAASIVAGFIILVDRPFQVGDRITFDGYYGEVVHIGLRSVRLMTLDDTQVTIPNNKFLTDSVASGNAGAVEMMIQMDFFVAVDQDASEAKRIVAEALTSSRYFDIGHRWSVTLAQVVQESYLAVRIRAKAYVLDVRFEKAFETDVTERVLEAFRDRGIKMPAVLHRSC